MGTLEYIKKQFSLEFDDRTRMPVEIPNFGRDGLAEIFGDLNFRYGVEIGVRGGDYSLTLMQLVPNLTLWGIDPYISHTGYRDITRQTTFDKFELEAHNKLDPYPQYTFVKEFSERALPRFVDGSLDFVYIDGDHCFESVTADLAGWSKKVKKGGIIAGDDYFKHKGRARIHVYQAVNGYTDAWQIRPWFVLGSKAIVEGEVRDHGRSWMWVKQ